jgi:hypothetical protein
VLKCLELSGIKLKPPPREATANLIMPLVNIDSEGVCVLPDSDNGVSAEFFA